MESMEISLPVKTVFILLLLFLCGGIFSETLPSDKIRFRLWVLEDEMPSLDKNADDKSKESMPEKLSPDEPFYMPAVRNLQSLAPFMLEGMLYGWNYSYTPSDKTRMVSEYFEATSVREDTVKNKDIHWTEFELKEGKYTCWVEYERTLEQRYNKQWWNSVKCHKISGTGYAPVADGTDGIKAAVLDAIKKGVREYARSIEKNKPKEINGTILLAEKDPRVYIDHGQFVADLDFFLYVDKIERYTQF